MCLACTGNDLCVWRVQEMICVFGAYRKLSVCLACTGNDLCVWHVQEMICVFGVYRN